VLTALAAIVYYRHRVISNPADFLTVGILPLGAIGVLVWVVYKSVQSANAAQNLTLAGVVVAGLVLMILVRLILRPAFFRTARESAQTAAES
jgi:hypothetical protein